MNVDKIGVHTSHCCARHGCKYLDDNCPVYSAAKDQEYPCPYCRGPEEIEASMKQDALDLEWAKRLQKITGIEKWSSEQW